MAQKSKAFGKGIRVKATDDAATLDGEIRNDATEKRIKVYHETDGTDPAGEYEVVSTDQTQTLTNKTVTNPVLNGDATGTAIDTDDTLAADSDTKIPSQSAAKGYVDTHIADTSTHGVTGDIVGTSGSQSITDKIFLGNTFNSNVLNLSFDHSASLDSSSGEITVSPVKSLIYVDNPLLTGIVGLDGDATKNERVIIYNRTGVDVAIRNEDASAVADTRITTGTGTDLTLAANCVALFQYTNTDDRWIVVSVSGKIDADTVAVTPSGNLASTDAQAAFEELQADIDTRATSTALNDHINDTTDAHDASAISYDNTSSGLTATDAQAAVDEVEDRLDLVETNQAQHFVDTSVHGVSGAVVGTTDAQTLTNKTLDSTNTFSGAIDNPTKLEAKQDTLANLETYAATATNGEIVYATDTDQMFRVLDGALAAIGGGGGGGLDVYYTEDFEDLQDVSDFSTGNNATFLGGGTLAGTLALETTTEIAGSQSLSYTQASGSLNDYFASPVIDIDLKQQNNDSGMTFYFTYDGADNDGKFVVWDVTNSTELTSGVELVEAESGATRYALSFYVPATCTQIRWGYQVLVENIGAELVMDDVEITSNPFVFKDLLSYHSLLETGTSGTTVDLTSGTTSGDSQLFSTSGDTLTSLRKINVTASISSNSVSGGVGDFTEVSIIRNGTLLAFDISRAPSSGISVGSSATVSIDLNEGDTLEFAVGGSTTPTHRYSILAIASTEHVITPAKSTSEFYFINSAVTNVWDTGGAGLESNWDYTLLSSDITQSAYVEIDETTDTTQTRIVAKKPCRLDISATSVANTIGSNLVLGYNGVAVSLDDSYGSGTWASVSGSLDMSVGDYIYLEHHDPESSSRQLPLTIAIAPKEASLLAAIPTPKTAYIKDVKPSGTAGGTFTSGAWQTRDLNDLSGDTGFVSLSANAFTLQPGKYEIEASAPGFRVDNHKLRLQNITDSSTSVLGTSARTAAAGDYAVSRSYMTLTLKLTSSKTFEIQHRSSATRTGDGFGVASNFGAGIDEIYTQVSIKKVG